MQSLSNKLAMLEYTETPWFEVANATKTINLVEELLFYWNGEVIMDPPADIWMDETTLPALQVDARGDFEAWQRIIGNVPSTTEWGSWNTTWTDRQVSTADFQNSSEQTDWQGNSWTTTRTTQTSRTTTTTDSTGQSREGIVSTVSSTETQNNLGTRVSDFQVEYYMRPRRILIGLTKMKPNSRLKIMFDNRDVTSMCTMVSNLDEIYANFTLDVAIFPSSRIEPKTDASGNAAIFFSVPENTFLVGNKKLEVIEDEPTPKTSATGYFDASGFKVTKQDTILSTRQPQMIRTSTQESRVLTNTTRSTATIAVDQQIIDQGTTFVQNEDPVGQTFFVDETCLLTSLELFFYKKSETLGLRVEIRTSVNGYPGTELVPFGRASLTSQEVQTSGDGSRPTKFQFETPVLLQGGQEYAFVIIPEGNSSDYEAWVVELGGEDINTRTRVTRSPFSGSLFTSQNNRVWTPRQSLDLKMKFNRANVNFEQPGTFVVNNDDSDFIIMKDIVGKFIPGEIIKQNIDATTRAMGRCLKIVDNKMYIERSNGLFSKDKGDIYGETSNAFCKIEDFFDIMVNTIHVQMSYLEFENTLIDFYLTYATPSGARITNKINTNVDIPLQTPAIVRSRSQEVSLYSGLKSIVVSTNMNSSTSMITPIVDLEKIGIILVTNRIGNSPLQTEIFDGDFTSKNSRYITKPVILAEGMDAEDLHVYLTADVPANSFVDVFYKLIHSDDTRDITENYSLHEWVQMQGSQQPSGFGFKEYKFVPFEDKYDSDGILKYSYNGREFSGFKIYLIKIVMRSEDSSLIPIIKNFRSIALQR